MSESITLNSLDLSGESLTLYLRKADGSLLNTDGDAMVEQEDDDENLTGVFTATLAESRDGLGTLQVRVCVGSETADNLVYDGKLNPGTTVIDDAGYAVLDAGGHEEIAAAVNELLSDEHGLGSWEGGGGAGGGLTGPQATQLDEIHEAIYPEDPDTEPLVILPGTGNVTTGYLTCLDTALAPQAGVVVSQELLQARVGESGLAYNGATVLNFTAAGNGVVQIPCVKGATYRFWRGTSQTGSLVVTIDADAGGTFVLPSLIGR